MLQMEFHTTRGALKNFLGLKKHQSVDESITINQDYTKIFERFEMNESISIGREDSNERKEMSTMFLIVNQSVP